MQIENPPQSSQDSIKDVEFQQLGDIKSLLHDSGEHVQIDTPAFITDSQGYDHLLLQNKKRGRKSKYDGAEYPELIDKAKLLLPHTNYDIESLLELEEFRKLRNSSDLPRFISKYVLNKTAKGNPKSMIAKSIKSFDCSKKIVVDYSQMGHHNPRHNGSQPEGPSSSTQLTPQANYGAKIQSELTSNYLREYMLLKPQERYQFLEKICQRNSQSLLEFLINLKTTCSSSFYDGMFSIIHELIVNSKVDLQIKTRLFVQSLLFYKNEIIYIEPELLKNSMNLLAQRPNSEQTLGLANYVFINEIKAFSEMQEELVLLDRKNIGIIPLMGCTFTSYKIDPQVIRLLPNTLQCLNRPFIQILKQDHGLRLIREIPINVVGDFVQICALSQARNYQDLDKLISHISDIFIKQWDFLDQCDFSLLIAQLSVELKE